MIDLNPLADALRYFTDQAGRLLVIAMACYLLRPLLLAYLLFSRRSD